MSFVYRCDSCDGLPDWRIERFGDAVVSWACFRHLSYVCLTLQRAHEHTRLAVMQATAPDPTGTGTARRAAP